MLLATFDSTGGVQSFVVPAGITSIQVEMWGGQGGGYAGFGVQGSTYHTRGGKGGYLACTLAVTPGETLSLYVGGGGAALTPGGSGGFNGGGSPGNSPSGQGAYGGGGATDIRRGATKLLIAGGGGGSGPNIGNFTTATPAVPSGGNGGGGSGTAGTSATQGGPGGGATTGAGGSAGTAGGSGSAGAAGTSGQGGGGGAGAAGTGNGGGGGGGGLYGGGGGGGANAHPGTAGVTYGGYGGGGSSYTAPSGVTGITQTQGLRIGAGRIVISYPEPAPNTPTDLSPAAGSTLTTDTPLLGAYVSTNYSGGQPAQGKVKVEWQIAKDQLFTISSRTFLQGDAELKFAGQGQSVFTSLQVPGAQRLPQGTWYLRARTIDWNGTSSQYSGYQTFRVANSAATLAHSPTENQAVQWAAGGTTFTWVYANSNLGSQSAYQVTVEDAAGATVGDTGKVLSQIEQAVVVIPATLKNQSLRWKVKVWDSDDIEGDFSEYNVFRVADLPTVVVGTVTTVGTPNPTFTYVATPSGSPISQKRLIVTRDSDGVVFFDSGWLS